MSYKIYYNSKLAKVLTFIKGFSTMMFFGTIITEESSLTEKQITHEGTHVRQYWDCFAVGMALGIVLMFVLFAFDVTSWWILLLLLIPLLLYYTIYGVEYLYWLLRGYNYDEAYNKIGFERQAYWIAETWNKPCADKNEYTSFGWWNLHEEDK